MSCLITAVLEMTECFSFFITDILDATLSLSWDLQDDDEERRARNQQRRQAKNLETGMSVTESPGMDRQVYLWL